MEQEEIIACAFKVHNTLGFGFLEKVYENALKIELLKNNFEVKQQYPLPVYYDDNLVDDYFADIVVNENIVVEIKTVETLVKIHEAQLVNYLKASNNEFGLLINFGKSVQVKRKYKNPKEGI